MGTLSCLVWSLGAEQVEPGLENLTNDAKVVRGVQKSEVNKKVITRAFPDLCFAVIAMPHLLCHICFLILCFSRATARM